MDLSTRVFKVCPRLEVRCRALPSPSLLPAGAQGLRHCWRLRGDEARGDTRKTPREMSQDSFCLSLHVLCCYFVGSIAFLSLSSAALAGWISSESRSHAEWPSVEPEKSEDGHLTGTARVPYGSRDCQAALVKWQGYPECVIHLWHGFSPLLTYEAIVTECTVPK